MVFVILRSPRLPDAEGRPKNPEGDDDGYKAYIFWILHFARIAAATDLHSE